jgi:hypothetical protein
MVQGVRFILSFKTVALSIFRNMEMNIGEASKLLDENAEKL